MVLKKRHIILSAAVTFLVAACTQNDIFKMNTDEEQDVLIGFETFHEKSTKTATAATGEISGPSNFTRDANGNGGLGVWGFKGVPSAIPAASAVSNYTIDVSDENVFKPIFENVQVWYEDADDPMYGPKGFTYLIPKYWDKKAEYIFFAYAPYNNTLNASDEEIVSFDKTTGRFTVRDIESIQDISKHTGSGESLQYGGTGTVPNSTDKVYQAADATDVIDYLMARYETKQKYNGTNQAGKPGYADAYTSPDDYRQQTVGFTFRHMLSRITINLQAEDTPKGIKSMAVSYLTIDNMPGASTDKALFIQNSPTAATGTYTPSTWAGKTLQIINTDATTNANATSKSKLYILKDGSLSGETVTKPTDQKQSFYYYVAPSTADDPSTTGVTEKYILNIKYEITYLDGTTEEVDVDPIDLSSKLTALLQNRSYTLTINVDLNQILFCVNEVVGWGPAFEQEITVPESE
ncbi:MAG: fimbrillin family protein [Bacteroidaceae bacterium]|nr:fimbrillin family protein [Bacteroidaceae bacterium]